MERRKDVLVTLLGDALAFSVAWYVFYYLRFELQWFGENQTVAPALVLLPGLIITVYWLAMFAFFGLYKRLYLASRFDEILRVAKISLIGILVFFFLLFTDDLNWNPQNIAQAKNLTLVYWLLIFGFVSLNRIVVRTIQKVAVSKGYGLHKAVIIGIGDTAKEVYADIMRHKTTGLDVAGFIDASRHTKEDDIKIDRKLLLGKVQELNTIIETHGIEDVIVAVEPANRDKLITILDLINKPNISVKLIPDFYQIISGMNKTNQIFGLPLIEVMPDPMPAWEKSVKRLMDVVLSILILVVSAPVMLLVALIIRLTDPGPVIFAQERVGLFGRPFIMYKFRSMYVNAEAKTGPTWATENDSRITPVGYWLRKLRLDELPQLWNVIKGDMSLVGPRPEREHFVNQFKAQIPLYARRLRVRPGITGWAQVKWKYDETFDDVKEKTKYDLFYVENISLKMDIKILINTIATMLSGKGQ
ncbi:Undecaprenyl-phosphate glucose phosphotransferase [Cyclonatronum proteinivorum]|uniref:Undecaprenyl-phosphate glucose phosphotransferase n=1 Tax=Cyclonatronum proteinivorum TaxID=1457365 RepID=A0A345UJW9_9BACT|nr:sugar transferase [Cyclonatronum proteinivorum]AXJ00771.1 Undecaprenyl-phosphate glucose phosphotransferase [Cyclonatronum proteinivorum]